MNWWPGAYSGWTCGRCGTWVPNGTFHMCAPTTHVSVPPLAPPKTTDERIADALERIADALNPKLHQHTITFRAEGDANRLTRDEDGEDEHRG